MLQALGGKAMVVHVIDTVQSLGIDTLHIVLGHAHKEVQAHIDAQGHSNIHFYLQKEYCGTADAVACARPAFAADKVLILYGDVPIIPAPPLTKLLNHLDSVDLVVLTMLPSNNYGYGRIIRNAQGQVKSIVEEKDATESERAILEVSSGIMAARGKHLQSLLSKVDKQNAQGEYYLPDIVGLASEEGLAVAAEPIAVAEDAQGVNTLKQLEQAERHFQRQQADRLLEQGCCLRDAKRLDIRGEVEVGTGVVIDVNVVLEGKVTIGDNVQIGLNCYLKNVVIGEGTTIKPYTMMEDATVGCACSIGPYARLRPGSVIEDQGQVGNFVELKKSTIGKRSKVNHLSYIGDSTVGKDTNIGAGTITCNYDGAAKHQTIIGDNVFIGSDTQLIAPVTIEDGATIGAGSTITKDAPKETLTLSRAEQTSIAGWKRAKPSKSKN